VIFG